MGSAAMYLCIFLPALLSLLLNNTYSLSNISMRGLQQRFKPPSSLLYDSPFRGPPLGGPPMRGAPLGAPPLRGAPLGDPLKVRRPALLVGPHTSFSCTGIVCKAIPPPFLRKPLGAPGVCAAARGPPGGPSLILGGPKEVEVCAALLLFCFVCFDVAVYLHVAACMHKLHKIRRAANSRCCCCYCCCCCCCC